MSNSLPLFTCGNNRSSFDHQGISPGDYIGRHARSGCRAACSYRDRCGEGERPYKVKAFQPAEYKTLQRLAEIIVPKDDVSGSGLDAGAPEFIDCSPARTKLLRISSMADWPGSMRRCENATSQRSLTQLRHSKPRCSMYWSKPVVSKQPAGTKSSYTESLPTYKDFSGYTVHRRQ